MIQDLQRLNDLRAAVDAWADPKRSLEFVHRVDVQERVGRFEVNYYGNPFDEVYIEFVEVLATCLRELTVPSAPDQAFVASGE